MAKYTGATVTGFTAYHEVRGQEIPGTWDEAYIEATLLVGSEWIDRTYGALFVGSKTGGFLQDRQWPRINAMVVEGINIYTFPNDTIPELVINAVYEAAWRQANNPGSLLVDYTPGKYKSVSIDGAVSVDYAQFTSAYDIQKTFPAIDQILWPLFDPTASGSFSSYSGDVARV